MQDPEQIPRSQTSALWHAIEQSPQFWALVSGFTQTLLQTISPVPHVGIPPSVEPPDPPLFEPPVAAPPVLAPPVPGEPPVLVPPPVPAEASGVVDPAVSAVSSLPQWATKTVEPRIERKARMDLWLAMIPFRGRFCAVLLGPLEQKITEPLGAGHDTASAVPGSRVLPKQAANPLNQMHRPAVQRRGRAQTASQAPQCDSLAWRFTQSPWQSSCGGGQIQEPFVQMWA